MDVRIVNFPATKVAVLEHRGPPDTEHESVQKLIKWRIENKIPLATHQSYGVHFDDPSSTPPEKYRVDLCISVETDTPENKYGVINKIIPSGRCALVRHIGSRDNVSPARLLYQEWLPSSGEILRDFPIFFHYVNVGPDIREEAMITDVYLPIQ